MISRVRCQNCGGNAYVFGDYSQNEPNMPMKLTLHCLWCAREIDENGNVIGPRPAPNLVHSGGHALQSIVRFTKSLIQ